MPPIASFEIFAKKLAAANKKASEKVFSDSKSTDTNKRETHVGVEVISADYKKTDSIVNPVVGVLVLREVCYQTVKQASGEFLGFFSSTHKYTFTFAYKGAKWVLVKATVMLENHDSVPKMDYDGGEVIGQDQERPVENWKSLADEAQR
jgi:hypothetical protein